MIDKGAHLQSPNINYAKNPKNLGVLSNPSIGPRCVKVPDEIFSNSDVPF